MRQVFHILDGNPITLVVVDTAKLGRIACQQNILLDGVELNGIHIRNRTQQRRHPLLIPRGNRTHRNHNPFNGSTQKIHQICDLVRAIDDWRSRKCHHLAILCCIEDIIELPCDLRRVRDTGDEVMDLINDDHAVVIRIRAVLRDILAYVRRR